MRREPAATYHRGTFFVGLVFALLGVVFLLDGLGVLTLRGAYLAPILLISAGMAVLMGGRRSATQIDEPE